MKSLFSQISGKGRSSWLRPVLISFFLVAALILFNHGFADEPDLEHPWDDLCGGDADHVQVNNPNNPCFIVLPIGVTPHQIVVQVESRGHKDNMGKEKVSQPSEKNRIHFFIFIK